MIDQGSMPISKDPFASSIHSSPMGFAAPVSSFVQVIRAKMSLPKSSCLKGILMLSMFAAEVTNQMSSLEVKML